MRQVRQGQWLGPKPQHKPFCKAIKGNRSCPKQHVVQSLLSIQMKHMTLLFQGGCIICLTLHREHNRMHLRHVTALLQEQLMHQLPGLHKQCILLHQSILYPHLHIRHDSNNRSSIKGCKGCQHSDMHVFDAKSVCYCCNFTSWS